MDDLYKILGVDKDASCEAIKAVYRKKAIEHHPDKGGDIQQMKQLTLAYRILSDPVERRIFDQKFELWNASEDSRNKSLGHLPTAGVAFATTFRKQHSRFYHQCEKNPLSKDKKLSLLSCNDDLFSSIKVKKELKTKFDIGIITPKKAIIQKKRIIDNRPVTLIRTDGPARCIREMIDQCRIN